MRDKNGVNWNPEHDAKIVVKYQSRGEELTEEEQEQIIKNIKQDHYYSYYLAGRFKYKFIDEEGYTKGVFIWKDAGGGGQHEAGERVIEMLATKCKNQKTLNETLPEGVTGVVMLRESSPYVAEGF